MTEPTAQQRRRSRRMLLVIFALFFGSLLIAGALRFAGWHPAGMKNHGELLQPPGDLRAVVPQLVDGGDYRWTPTARLWRIAVVPPAGCADTCIEVARQLDLVWQLFGKDADRVHILWIGAPPAGAQRNAATRVLQPSAQLLAGVPRREGESLANASGKATSVPAARGVPVYVIDPNGFVILRYAPGFDPAGLRADMAKLLKLM